MEFKRRNGAPLMGGASQAKRGKTTGEWEDSPSQFEEELSMFDDAEMDMDDMEGQAGHDVIPVGGSIAGMPGQSQGKVPIIRMFGVTDSGNSVFMVDSDVVGCCWIELPKGKYSVREEKSSTHPVSQTPSKVDLFPYLGRMQGVQSVLRESSFQSKQMGRRENKTINMEGRVQFDLLQVSTRYVAYAVNIYIY
ncbi:hypothetical protein XENOCAPTIV_003469 [Xenoophorus captivus]|uniref:Uncharacterized protein n=1 Tax=Xenoophorus captivus TaxID=1517983 RepID=A0ABV0RF97_9TELE